MLRGSSWRERGPAATHAFTRLPVTLHSSPSRGGPLRASDAGRACCPRPPGKRRALRSLSPLAICAWKWPAAQSGASASQHPTCLRKTTSACEGPVGQLCFYRYFLQPHNGASSKKSFVPADINLPIDRSRCQTTCADAAAPVGAQDSLSVEPERKRL